MTEDPPQCRPLQKGQSLTVFVEGGTHVVAAHGSLFIGAACAADTSRALLQEGEAYLVETACWLRLSAPEGGQALMAAAPSAPSRIARLVHLLRSLLRVHAWQPR